MQLIKKSFFLTLALFIVGISNTAVNAQNSSDNEAAVTITEYSDYQCPTCAYFHPIVEKIKTNFGSQVDIDHRYFPLNSHEYATIAAQAAEAAKNQGKFKQMHDLLLENQKRWSDSDDPEPIFTNFAREIDLDIKEFKEDLDADETRKTVMKQKQEGASRNVRGTPTYFINGEKVRQLPRDYQSFEKLIESYLAEDQSN